MYATTRCLYSCYDVICFGTMTRKIYKSLVDKTLNPEALDLFRFQSEIGNIFSPGKEVPIVMLIDEISKSRGDDAKLIIPAINRMMDDNFACVWTTLAEGPFERAETPSQRYINRLFLPALSTESCRTILIEKNNLNKVNTMCQDLYLVWNKITDRDPINSDDVINMLSEAAGGLPRGVEKIYLELERLDITALKSGSTPLLSLLKQVSDAIKNSYGGANSNLQRCDIKD